MSASVPWPTDQCTDIHVHVHCTCIHVCTFHAEKYSSTCTHTHDPQKMCTCTVFVQHTCTLQVSSRRSSTPSLFSMRSMQGWLSVKLMNDHSISSLTYSACSSWNTCCSWTVESLTYTCNFMYIHEHCMYRLSAHEKVCLNVCIILLTF